MSITRPPPKPAVNRALSKQGESRVIPAHAAEFQSVRTLRAFEAVADQIRQQISSGVLKPGDKLPAEKTLSEQFRTSRSAVREALRSLEAGGVVEARTGINGGFFIHRANSIGLIQSVQDMVALGRVPLADVTEARIELMRLAIRLACERATEADFDAIEADIDHHVSLFAQGRSSRDTRSVIHFYELIARATHNEIIVLMVDALSEIIRTLLVKLNPKPSKDIMEVRRNVLQLMRKRDAQRACDAMSAHLHLVNDYLERAARRAAKLALAKA